MRKKYPISHCLWRLRGFHKVNSDGGALIFSCICVSFFTSRPFPPPTEDALLYFYSRRFPRESLSSLRLGKWQPRRQTGALHLVTPEGPRHETNESGSVAPPRSTWLISRRCGRAASWGFVASPSRSQRDRAARTRRGKSSLTTKTPRPQVDKFINDNNEVDEDDDNINN